MLQKVLLKSLDHLLALGASRGMKQILLQTGEHPPVEQKNLMPNLPNYPSISKMQIPPRKVNACILMSFS